MNVSSKASPRLEDPRRSTSVLRPRLNLVRQWVYNYSPAKSTSFLVTANTTSVIRFEWVKLCYLPSRRLLPKPMSPLYVVQRIRTLHQVVGNFSRNQPMATLRLHSTHRIPSPQRKLQRNWEWTSSMSRCCALKSSYTC
jgi:hypothetical protein